MASGHYKLMSVVTWPQVFVLRIPTKTNTVWFAGVWSGAMLNQTSQSALLKQSALPRSRVRHWDMLHGYRDVASFRTSRVVAKLVGKQPLARARAVFL